MDQTELQQHAGFEQLLRPHMERLYRLAYHLAGDKTEAEDLFQEVLTKIYVRLDELREIDEPGPWLSRVLYNHFVDNHRRLSRRRMIMVEEGHLPGNTIESLAAPDSPEQDAITADNMLRLRSAMAKLSAEHRQLILLHDAEGYKMSEIQGLTGSPIGTIKSRLHRARARLRELLANDGTFF